MIDHSGEQVDQTQRKGSPSGGDPGLESMMVQSRTKSPDIPSKLLEGDIKPERFIPRANLTADLGAAMLRMTMDNNIMETGKADMDHIMWMATLNTMGLNGWATDNVVSIFQAQSARRERGGFLGGVLGRGKKRDMNGQENVEAV